MDAREKTPIRNWEAIRRCDIYVQRSGHAQVLLGQKMRKVGERNARPVQD